MKPVSPEILTHQFIQKVSRRRTEIMTITNRQSSKYTFSMKIQIQKQSFSSDILRVYSRTTEDLEDSRVEIIFLYQAILTSKVEPEHSENLIEEEFPILRFVNANENLSIISMMILILKKES